MRGEFVEVGGQQLYYYAAGTRGDGVPVVFLHGFPTSSRLWHAVIRDFPAGHRLVLCDLPGFGRSSLDLGAKDCALHARAVAGLLDDLRIERACLVGHGIGGAVAQAIAVGTPRRVSHLALIDSAAFGAIPRGMARLARALHPFTTELGRDRLVRHLRALDRCETADLTPRLATLGIPTTILWGEDDPFYPVRLAARLRDAIPGATLDVVPGARHFLPEDAPERVLAALVALLAREPALLAR